MPYIDMDRPVETPHRLRDVEDPCTELYYPEWSSRGMRAVRCTRHAIAWLQESSGPRRVCGIHARRYARLGDPWDVEYDK